MMVLFLAKHKSNYLFFLDFYTFWNKSPAFLLQRIRLSGVCFGLYPQSERLLEDLKGYREGDFRNPRGVG